MLIAFIIIVAAGCIACLYYKIFVLALFLGFDSILLGFAYKFNKDAEAEWQDFSKWLIDNFESVREGSASYKGQPITVDTYLVQYQTCTSVIFSTLQVTSNLMLPNNNLRDVIKIVFTLNSLLLGWWGLPSGPIWTIQSIVNNISNATRKSVGSIIYDIEDVKNRLAPG